MKCPYCGSSNYNKRGRNQYGTQRYACQCGRSFNSNTAADTDLNISIDKNKNNPQMQFDERENSAVGSIITAIKPRTMRDAAFLFKVDLTVWEPERMVTNSWDVTNRKGESFTNYQVKVWFKKIIHKENPEELARIFQDHVNSYVPGEDLFKIDRDQNKKDKLLEISIADLHLGKLAWHRETNENYDIKIAEQRFFQSLGDLIEKGRIFNPRRILYVIGNDFLNADSLNDTTTGGTYVDSDVRWQKRYLIGCRILVQSVIMLLELAPVDIEVIPGNHDGQTSFYLGEYLKAWFRNCSEITIDNSPLLRKYYRFGNNLIGLAHEHRPLDDIPMLMVQEAKDDFAVTQFHEFHTGHKHREESIDVKGVVIRKIKSLSGVDSWHYRHGYIGTIKGAEAFIFDHDTGLEAHLHNNLVV